MLDGQFVSNEAAACWHWNTFSSTSRCFPWQCDGIELMPEHYQFRVPLKIAGQPCVTGLAHTLFDCVVLATGGGRMTNVLHPGVLKDFSATQQQRVDVRAFSASHLVGE